MNTTMLLKQEILKVGYYAWYFEARSADGQLPGTGAEWRTIRCPFHQDSHRSLRVHLSKGCWICMAGCGKGDLFSFHAKVLGVDAKTEFPKVVESLAGELGIDMTKVDATASPSAAAAGAAAPVETPKWAGFEDAGTFLSKDGDAGVPYLFEELVPYRAITVIGGLPKSGKSWLSIDLAIALAAGQPFLGKALGGTYSRAGIICEEDVRQEIQKRIWWLARGRGIDPRDLHERLFVSAQSGFRLDDPKMAVTLLDWIKKLQLDVVVFDPIRRLHGMNENDSTEMQKVFTVLRQVAKETTVIVVAHTRKHNGEGSTPGHLLRGSGDLWALARAVLGVKRNNEVMTIEADGNYVTSNDPLRLAFVVEENADGTKVARFDRDQQSAGGVVDLDAQILQAIEEAGGLTTTQLRERGFAGHGALDKALADLYTAGKLRKEVVVTQDRKGRNRPQELWMLAKPDATVVDGMLVRVEPDVVDSKPLNGTGSTALVLTVPF